MVILKPSFIHDPVLPSFITSLLGKVLLPARGKQQRTRKVVGELKGQEVCQGGTDCFNDVILEEKLSWCLAGRLLERTPFAWISVHGGSPETYGVSYGGLQWMNSIAL